MANAPFSNKVTTGSLSGGVLGVITAVLLAAVPSWHGSLPSYVVYMLPVALTVIGHFGGGWAARHTATVVEVERWVDDAKSVLALVPDAPKAP
jgi:hypothetical protein